MRSPGGTPSEGEPPLDSQEGETIVEPIGGRPARIFAASVVALRWVILPVWLAAAVAAALYLPSVTEGSAATLGDLLPAHSRAAATEERVVRLFRIPLLAQTVVVQRDPHGLSHAAQLRVVRRALRIDRHRNPLLRSISLALPITNFRGTFPAARERGTTALTYLFFRRDASVGAQNALAHTYAKEYVDRPGDALVGVTGAVPARYAQFQAIKHALPIIEASTVALIALILGLSFRSVGVPLATLFVAGIAFVLDDRVLGWVSEKAGLSIPREVKPVTVALLLGIVTDYAVFFFSGARRRLVVGEPRVEVARRTTAEYGPIVLTAGLVVAAGTATLAFGTLGFFRSFGPGMAITVLTGLAVSVTALPALIAIFGRLLFWPGSHPSEANAQDEQLARRERTARFLAGRPLAVVIALAALAALVVPTGGVTGAALGFRLIRSLDPGTEPVRAARAAEAGFAPGILAPVEILIEQRGLSRRRPALLRLQAALARQPGVAGVVGPATPRAVAVPGALLARSGNAARYLVILDVDPQSARGIRRVKTLERALPSLLRKRGLSPSRTGFAGESALAAETVDSVTASMKRIAIAAFLVNLVLLAIFLQAIVAPLYLLFASALGLTAALGLTTLVFQRWQHQGDLTYYVPLAAGVLLVSLGSDYNLFVVGRIWLEARRRPLRDAIAVAAPRASRAIRIAGVALACSFALLAIVPLDEFRTFAFAMAAGVLVDTFLVRAVLVPALIALFGGASWWPRSRPTPPPAPEPE